MRFRYSAWDGTQEPVGPDVSASELLDAMSEDILAGEGAEGALQRLLRRGIRGRFSGTDALAARLRQVRRREQERLDLEGPLREVADRLDDILERERTALSFRADEDARTRETFLDALPPDLARQVLSDLDLQFEADRLASNLAGLFPDLPWGEPALAGGEEAMPLEATVGALERLHDFEDLDRSLRGEYPGAALEDVDEDALRRTLGEKGVADLRRLKEIERALERAGLVSRVRGRMEVTPRGARQLGERALMRVFEQLRRDREGTHETREAGGLAEPTGATRPWRFGDSGQLAVQRTVFNAVVRDGPGRSIRLHPDDFELVEAESRTETATALLLDLSFSMPLRGHFVPAKRMALALHALIEGRYPNDTLYLIGFSDYARRMEPRDLTAAGWERVYGTNMQHAFNLAGRLLSRHPRATRQVIMVTDGEPTAHLVGEEVFFSWPPVPETIRRTLSEALRLSGDGVTLNVFMLEESPGLARFMERLARLTSGRVFLMSAESAGDFVLRDYARRRAS